MSDFELCIDTGGSSANKCCLISFECDGSHLKYSRAVKLHNLNVGTDFFNFSEHTDVHYVIAGFAFSAHLPFELVHVHSGENNWWYTFVFCIVWFYLLVLHSLCFLKCPGGFLCFTCFFPFIEAFMSFAFSSGEQYWHHFSLCQSFFSRCGG